MPRFCKAVAAITTLLASVAAVTITENTVEISTARISIGDLTVNSGVFYSLVNNEHITFEGSVTNNGGLYVTSANGLTTSVAMTGLNVLNTGVVSFNSLGASAYSSYHIAALGYFKNTGNIYLGISGAPVTGVDLSITSISDWSNYGIIVLERSAGTPVLVGLEQNDGAQGVRSLLNEGAICLYNANWTQTSNILGSGCVNVASGSQFYLQIADQSAVYSISPTQIINLADSSSLLSIFGLNDSTNATYNYTVSGFGGGNSIYTNTPFTSLSYSEITGVLVLSFPSGAEISLNIGKGYDSSLFNMETGNSISYRGAPPNGTPNSCVCIPTFPKVITTPLASSSNVVSSSVSDSSSTSASSSISLSSTSETTSISDISTSTGVPTSAFSDSSGTSSAVDVITDSVGSSDTTSSLSTSASDSASVPASSSTSAISGNTMSVSSSEYSSVPDKSVPDKSVPNTSVSSSSLSSTSVPSTSLSSTSSSLMSVSSVSVPITSVSTMSVTGSEETQVSSNTSNESQRGSTGVSSHIVTKSDTTVTSDPPTSEDNATSSDNHSRISTDTSSLITSSGAISSITISVVDSASSEEPSHPSTDFRPVSTCSGFYLNSTSKVSDHSQHYTSSASSTKEGYITTSCDGNGKTSLTPLSSTTPVSLEGTVRSQAAISETTTIPTISTKKSSSGQISKFTAATSTDSISVENTAEYSTNYENTTKIVVSTEEYGSATSSGANSMKSTNEPNLNTATIEPSNSGSTRSASFSVVFFSLVIFWLQGGNAL